MAKDKECNYIIATRFKIFTFVILSMAVILSVQFASAAQLPVNLGTSGNFVILAKSGISTTGTTLITGDIGVSPIGATGLTGFSQTMDISNQFSTSSYVVGKLYAADYAVPTPAKMSTAVSDMETAYTDAAGRALPDYVGLGGGDISAMTLSPGLYKWSTGVLINDGVTLDCGGNSNAVFIFQIAQDLTVGSGAVVTLTGGCQPSNIFWQVAGQATLGTTSIFNGNILSQTLIAMNTGATLNGRALAQTAVTLIANNVRLYNTNNNNTGNNSNGFCGDGIITGNEQCDGGNCCTSNCTFKLAGIICRASTGFCDIAENCNGISSYCPSDLFKPQGTKCNDENPCTTNDVCSLGVCGEPITDEICGDGKDNDCNGLIDENCFKGVPVMGDNLFILLTVSTLILGLYYGFKKSSK